MAQNNRNDRQNNRQGNGRNQGQSRKSEWVKISHIEPQNNMVFVGRLGRDPEMQYTDKGMAIAKISLAADYYDRENEQRESEWFNVVAFRGPAETINEYVEKGHWIAFTTRAIEVWLNPENVGKNDLKGYNKFIVDGFTLIGETVSRGNGNGNRRGGEKREEPFGDNDPVADFAEDELGAEVSGGEDDLFAGL